MSRTYRRKNSKSWAEEKLLNGTIIKIDSQYYWVGYYYIWLEYNSDKEFKKAIRLYHSDKWDSYGGVPRWFVNQYCTRVFRSDNKKYISKIYNLIDYDDIGSAPVYKKNAGWMWF